MIHVLLPAFNEEAAIPILLDKIDRFMQDGGHAYTVTVCDDGSSDGTASILESLLADYPLTVITHSINRGLGETSRDLFEHAAANSSAGDVIVRLDCDATHEPAVIGAMLNRLEEGYDVIIASRFEEGGGQMGLDAYRTFISRMANLFMKCFFPIRGLKEYSCGFRAYRAELIQKAIAFYGNNFIQLLGLGFTCTLEKLVKLKIIGARFSEVPFVLRYDQKTSVSKMVSSVTTLGYLVLVILYYWPWGGWRRNYRARLRSES